MQDLNISVLGVLHARKRTNQVAKPYITRTYIHFGHSEAQKTRGRFVGVVYISEEA